MTDTIARTAQTHASLGQQYALRFNTYLDDIRNGRLTLTVYGARAYFVDQAPVGIVSAGEYAAYINGVRTKIAEAEPVEWATIDYTVIQPPIDDGPAVIIYKRDDGNVGFGVLDITNYTVEMIPDGTKMVAGILRGTATAERNDVMPELIQPYVDAIEALY